MCGLCYRDLVFYENRAEFLDLDVYSIFKHHALPRRFLLKYKFSGETYLSIFIAKFFLQCLLQRESVDFVVIVPLHPLKFFWRGFNQMGLVAKEMEDRGKVIILYDALKRIKFTKAQSVLSFKDRKKSVRGSFRINAKYKDIIKHKRLLLIDDVYTSGETVNGCISELAKLKPDKISVLTFTRSIKGFSGL